MIERSKMNITSNVIGKLEKIKNGSSFSDPLVIITEIMQNSQRAKAKELRITLEGDVLVFKDNGCGCRKPENILTLDYSEWDSTMVVVSNSRSCRNRNNVI